MIRALFALLIVAAVAMAGWLACLPDQPAVVAWPPDADVDAEAGPPPVPDVKCETAVDGGAPFENPKRVLAVPTGTVDRRGASLSRNEKDIYFGNSTGPFDGPLYKSTIHYAHRNEVFETFTDSGPWNAIQPLFGQDSPRFSADGNTVVLAGITQSGGKPHLYFAHLGNASADAGQLRPLALKVDGSQFELNPYLVMTEDGRGELFFSGCASGSTNSCDQPAEAASKDLYQVHINHPNLDEGNAFGALEPLGAINDERGFNESAPVVSSDKLEIFFARDGQIFRAWRKNEGDEFAHVNIVKELNLPGHSQMAPTWLSSNNCRLYFQTRDSTSTNSAAVDIWVAERKPPSN